MNTPECTDDDSVCGYGTSNLKAQYKQTNKLYLENSKQLLKNYLGGLLKTITTSAIGQDLTK